MAKKKYEDDDGRTIADMSGVSRPSMLGHLPGSLHRAGRRPEGKKEFFRAEEKELIPREERKWFILGALKAALLIALVFIVGLGLLILFLLLIWGAL